MKIADIIKKNIITMDDLIELITILKKMKQDTEMLVARKYYELSTSAVSELLSDIDVMKRFIEIAGDQGEEDLKDQEKIFDFLVILYRAMEGTHYESKVLPVAHSLEDIAHEHE